MTKNTSSALEIILASSSSTRKKQLKQLQLPFTSLSPDIDESTIDGESPKETAIRLSIQKAEAIQKSLRKTTINTECSVVIAGDQTLELQGQRLRKAKDHLEAQQQLQKLQGNEAIFHSGICVSYQNFKYYDCVSTYTHFRTLTSQQISTYLNKEDVIGCAGCLKFEALGISLISDFKSEDPSAILGLPLIKLNDYLIDLGLHPLGQ